MNKEEIVNEVMGSFKMTVDTKGLKKLEKYIDNLELESQELKDRINKAIEITHRILMNNADNRMICDEEEKEYFDWLDAEMLKQEKILKEDNKEESNTHESQYDNQND